MKIRGSTVYVPLSKSERQKRKYVMVDIDDFERVSQHAWYAMASGKTFYAIATSTKILPQHHARLHNFIMRAHHGERFDHINGNGLDCRKDNLRPATSAQNARNTYKTDSLHVTSKFKGVHRSPSSDRWIAQITFEGVPQALGVFDEEDDAARAYDEAAKRLFGEFAKTNAMMGLYDHDAPVRRNDHRGRKATFTTKSKLLGLPPKPRWQSFLDNEPPEIDRSIPHRDRRRSAAAKARRGYAQA